MLSIILQAMRSLALAAGSALRLPAPAPWAAATKPASAAEIAAWSIERKELRLSRKILTGSDPVPFC
jgi:hypothetical protein